MSRLPQELRVAGITTMEAANRFLRNVYLPRHNAVFARPAEEAGSAFVPFAGSLDDVVGPADIHLDLGLVPGDAFALFRRFENGLAVMNGTTSPLSVDLRRLDPARAYRAIEGTVTPGVNDGKPVGPTVTIPPLDGRVFLVRDT